MGSSLCARVGKRQHDAAARNRASERRSELWRGHILLFDQRQLVQEWDKDHHEQYEQGKGTQARVRSHPGRETPHPRLDGMSREPWSCSRVLEDPGPRVVEADREHDRQKEHLDASDPDRLQVDEDRNVLEDRLGEPDRKGVPVDGETRTEGKHERSTRGRDREPKYPDLPPPHSQCNQADEQRNTQIAGRVDQLWRCSQDRPEKIDVEGRDRPGRLDAASDAPRTCEEVADRIAGDQRETSACREEPGRRHANTGDDFAAMGDR